MDTTLGRRHLNPVSAAPTARVVIVMGVSGAGKSSFGGRLATAWGVPFIEGDELQPRSNVLKMSAGRALEDADRWPWLDAVAVHIASRLGSKGVVATCSALKRIYRDRLREKIAPPLTFACLLADEALLRARLHSRRGHFMPAALLASQLNIFELPDADECAVILWPDELQRQVSKTLQFITAEVHSV